MFVFRNFVLPRAVRGLNNYANKINYYEILGLKSNATQEEIKTAYYELSKKYHPDLSKSETDAKQQFLQATEAYEILGNTNLRQKYDSGSLNIRDIESRKEHSSAPTSEFEDYSRGLRKKQPLSRMSSTNFDQWSKTHYSKIIDHSAVTKDRLRSEKAREKTVIFQNRLELFIVGVFVIGALIIGSQIGHQKTPQPPKK